MQLRKLISVLFISLLALCILSGCIEMTRQEKNLCYSLVSQSYAYIPACETESSCFAKVNSMFNTKLSPGIESELYKMKNNVARSWFFYNKAVKTLDSMKPLCQAGNAQALAGKMNDLTFQISQSFLELDLGMKASFEIIAAEEKFLAAQDVDSVKEEPVYDSLIALRQVLSELNGGATNSDSYVSYYMNKAEAFNKSAFSKNYPSLVESTPFWIRGFEYQSGALLSSVGLGKEGEFPFIAGAFENGMDYAESLFYKKQSFTALQTFPAKEFMLLYSNLGGNRNSALYRFSELMNETSANHLSAGKNLQEYWKDISKALAENEALLKDNSSAGDFLFLSERLLGIKVQSQSDARQLFSETKAQIINLREEKNSGKLTLGKELQELKLIANSLETVRQAFAFEKGEYFSRLSKACEDKSAEIKNMADSSGLASVEKILDDAKFFASKVSSQDPAAKLKYCSQMLFAQEKYNLAISNYSEFEALEKNSAKDCFSYLDRLFPEVTGLDWLKNSFASLKNSEITKENLRSISSTCTSIRDQAQSQLMELEEIKQIQDTHYKVINSAMETREISLVVNEPGFSQKVEKFYEKLKTYDKYFDDSKNPLLLEVLPVKDVLLSMLNESLMQIDALGESGIILYAQKNLEILELSSSVTVAGANFDSNAVIVIPNPFKKINSAFKVELPIEVNSVFSGSECVRNSFGNKSILVLECLPFGGVEVGARVNAKAAVIEKDNVISASNQESIIKRDIQIDSQVAISRLLIKTFAPAGTQNIAATLNGKEIPAILSSGVAELYISNASQNDSLNVFFYINGVIQTEFSFSADNGAYLEYDLYAKNTYAKEISSILILPLPSSSGITNASVLNEEYSDVKAEIAGNKLIIRNVTLLPLATAHYFVKLYVNSSEDFFISGINEQISFFSSHGMEFEATTLRAAFLEAKNNPAKLSSIWAKYQKLVDGVIDSEAQNSALESKRAEIENGLAALEAAAGTLEELGLSKESKQVFDFLSEIKQAYAGSAYPVDSVLKKMLSLENKIGDALGGEVKKMENEVNKITGSYNDASLLAKCSEFVLLKKGFLEMYADPLGAINKYSELHKNFSEIIGLRTAIDENNNSLKKENARLVGAAYSAAADFIEALELQLLPNIENLSRIGVISPISKSRLAQLKLSIEEVKNDSVSDEQKLAKLSKINMELSSAFSELKKMSAREFNAGIDSGKDSGTLQQAKALIDRNNFAGALLILSSAQSGSAFGFRLEFILPIIAIIIIALILKSKVKKTRVAEDEKRKLILEEWEK